MNLLIPEGDLVALQKEVYRGGALRASDAIFGELRTRVRDLSQSKPFEWTAATLGGLGGMPNLRMWKSAWSRALRVDTMESLGVCPRSAADVQTLNVRLFNDPFAGVEVQRALGAAYTALFPHVAQHERFGGSAAEFLMRLPYKPLAKGDGDDPVNRILSAYHNGHADTVKLWLYGGLWVGWPGQPAELLRRLLPAVDGDVQLRWLVAWYNHYEWAMLETAKELKQASEAAASTPDALQGVAADEGRFEQVREQMAAAIGTATPDTWTPSARARLVDLATELSSIAEQLRKDAQSARIDDLAARLRHLRDDLAHVYAAGFSDCGPTRLPEQLRPMEPVRITQIATLVGSAHATCTDLLAKIDVANACVAQLSSAAPAARAGAAREVAQAQGEVDAAGDLLRARLAELCSALPEGDAPQAQTGPECTDSAQDEPADVEQDSSPPHAPVAPAAPVTAAQNDEPIHPAPDLEVVAAVAAAQPQQQPEPAIDADDWDAPQAASATEADEASQDDWDREALNTIARLIEGAAPGLALAYAHATDQAAGRPLPGGPSFYALLAAAEAQTAVVPSSNSYLDAHLVKSLEALSEGALKEADKPYVMAAFAAAIRPALFDMAAGNAVALMRAVAGASGIGHGFRRLADLASKPAAYGLHELRPDLLTRGYQASDAARERGVKVFAARAKAIIDRKDSATCKSFSNLLYAQHQYDAYLSDEHLIGKALRALADAPMKAATVRAVNAALQDLRGDREQYIQRGFADAGGPMRLIGAYHAKMAAFLEEMRQFLELAAAEIGWSPESADIERAADFSTALDSALTEALRELDGIAGAPALVLSALGCRRVLESMRGLIAHGTKPDSTMALDEYLGHGLLLGDLPLGPEVSGEAASAYAIGRETTFSEEAGRVRELIESVPLPIERTADAFIGAAQRHAAAGRFLAARRALSTAALVGATKDALAAPTREIDRRVQAARDDLNATLRRLQMLANQLYVHGLVPDQEKGSLDSMLEAMRVRSRSMPHLEPITTPDERADPQDFSEAQRYLDLNIGDVLTARLEHACDQLADEVTRESDGLSSTLKPDVQRVLDLVRERNLDLATEYWSILRSGKPIPTTGHGNALLADFHRRFLPTAAESGPLGNLVGETLRALAAGESLSWMPGNLAEPERLAAERMLDAWQALLAPNKRVQVGVIRNAVESFVTRHLGLSGISVSPGQNGGTPCVRIDHLNLGLQVGPDIFTLPSIGSERRGSYVLALVQHGAGLQALIEAVERADIVFYRGALSAEQRRTLMTRFRGAQRGALIVDDVLAVYMCLGASLDRMVAVGSAFLVSHPFADDQNMPPEMFFGRRAARQQILDSRAGVLVYGGRRLGKSSLLRDIAHKYSDPVSRRHFVYIDMNDATQADYRKVLWTRIADGLVGSGVLPKNTDRAATPARLMRLIADAATQKNHQIMVLVDEADDMLRMESEADQQFPTLRELSGLLKSTEGRFRFAIAGLHNTQRIARYPNSILDQFSEPVALTPFVDEERSAGLDLVVKPLAALGFEFSSPDMAYEIVSTAMFFPALIQVYCQRLLRELYKHPFAGLPPYRIERSHLDAVNADGTLANELANIFRKTLELDPRYRVLSFAMANQQMQSTTAGAFSMSADKLAGVVKGFAPLLFPESTEPSVIDALAEELVNLGVLMRANDGLEFQLRSVSLLSRLGTRSEIENALLTADSTKLARDDGEKRIRYSNGALCPIPVRAIADIGSVGSSRPPARIIVASAGTGAADLALMATDRAWLGGRAEHVVCRSSSTTGEEVIDRATRVAELPGRETSAGVTRCSRGVIVVPSPWPARLIGGLRHNVDRIAEGNRMLVLLAPPEQAWVLARLPDIPIPVVPTGLWNEDAVWFYARQSERIAGLDDEQVCALLERCGRVPLLIRAALDHSAGETLPSNAREACARAGIAFNVEAVAPMLGISRDLLPLVRDLGCSSFSAQELDKRIGATNDSLSPASARQMLQALGAIVPAKDDALAFNPIIDEALMGGD